jgi:hypothetical protein
VIPTAKIEGLRQLLAREGVATLRNGMRITRDPDWPADLLVLPEDGEHRRRVNEFAHDQLRQAYEIALAGPPPPPPPPVAPIRRVRSRVDFGGCPF